MQHFTRLHSVHILIDVDAPRATARLPPRALRAIRGCFKLMIDGLTHRSICHGFCQYWLKWTLGFTVVDLVFLRSSSDLRALGHSSTDARTTTRTAVESKLPFCFSASGTSMARGGGWGCGAPDGAGLGQSGAGALWLTNKSRFFVVKLLHLLGCCRQKKSDCYGSIQNGQSNLVSRGHSDDVHCSSRFYNLWDGGDYLRNESDIFIWSRYSVDRHYIAPNFSGRVIEYASPYHTIFLIIQVSNSKRFRG